MVGKEKKDNERTQIFDKEGVEAFVSRFVELRKKSGLTQRQLSFETGISQSYIGRLEKGKVNPTISVLFVLAKVLDVPAHELLKFDEENS